MSTAELVVELVLAGLLFLVALVAPAMMIGLVPTDLNADLFLPSALALGFAFGVIIDRMADSLLERWLGASRLAYATDDRVSERRARLVGQGIGVRDPFPEDWLRAKMTSTAPEAILKQHDAVRVRLRVARNMAVVGPALTTSAAVCVYLRSRLVGDDEVLLAALVAAAHLFLLLLISWLSDAGMKAPRTEHGVLSRGRRTMMIVSGFSCWLLSQAGLLLVLVGPGGVARRDVLLVGAIGALVTTLSIRAWWRITKTYFSLLWSYSEQHFPQELKQAIGRL